MQVRDRVRELRRVPAGELRPNPKNWRTHPVAQQDALRGVLAEVGYAGALLAREADDGGLVLIDGHLRAETTPDMEVPVLVLDVNEAEADKLLATIDPLGAMAEADAGKLDSLLREVDTGSEALQEMLAELAKDNGLYKTPEVVEDELPEPPANPVTQAGDLWVLGEHRLLCGDSTDTSCIDKLFAGGRAGLLFTSPPYAQQRDYGKAKQMVQDWDGLMHGVFGHARRIMEPDGQILVNLGLVHRDGEWVPYWDGWIGWMRENGWRRFGWYVWDQGSGLPGDWNGRLAPSHEFVFHFNAISKKADKWVAKKPENIHLGPTAGLRAKDGKIGVRSNREASLQATKLPDSVCRIPRAPAAGKGHPASFPVAFAANMLRSWPGLVYEPFAGSGSALIAAEQLERRCYAIELEPSYCDVIVERWEKLTGGKAQRQNQPELVTA